MIIDMKQKTTNHSSSFLSTIGSATASDKNIGRIAATSISVGVKNPFLAKDEAPHSIKNRDTTKTLKASSTVLFRWISVYIHSVHCNNVIE